MRKLLSILLLGLTLLLTGCGDKPGAEFVGKWQDHTSWNGAGTEFDIKPNGDSYLVNFTIGIGSGTPKTWTAVAQDQALVVGNGWVLTIDQSTKELVNGSNNHRYKRVE